MPVDYIRVLQIRCGVREILIALLVASCSINAGCNEGKPQPSPEANLEPVLNKTPAGEHDFPVPPPVSPEKEVVLNVGFPQQDGKLGSSSEALLFYAGDETPISEASRVLNREWRLYRDLGVDLEEVTIVIRCDTAVKEDDRQRLIDDCRKAGFQNITLVEVDREASE